MGRSHSLQGIGGRPVAAMRTFLPLAAPAQNSLAAAVSATCGREADLRRRNIASATILRSGHPRWLHSTPLPKYPT